MDFMTPVWTSCNILDQRLQVKVLHYPNYEMTIRPKHCFIVNSSPQSKLSTVVSDTLSGLNSGQ